MKNARLLLQNELQLPVYEMADFYKACPYSLRELRSTSRKQNISYWRHVGIAWLVLQGLSFQEASAEFGRNHSSGMSSVSVVLDSIKGNSIDEIREMVNLVKSKSGHQVSSTKDYSTLSGSSLEKCAFELRPWLFNPDLYYCMQMNVQRLMGEKAVRCKNQCQSCKTF